MTNAEKFESTFGFKPDTEFGILNCPEDYAGSQCPYYEELDGGCHCETWWNEEYKLDTRRNNMIITAEKAHLLTKDRELIMLLNACEDEINKQILRGSYEAVVYINMDFPCEILERGVEALRKQGYDVVLKGTLGLVFSEGQYRKNTTELHIKW